MLRALLFLGLTAGVAALPTGFGVSPAGRLDDQAWLSACSASRILYLGEEHDRAIDHQLQLDLIEAGSARVVLAEMFQNPVRDVLHDFVAGQVEEQGLRRLSQWDQRWGHAWELYWPIWQLCRERKIELRPLRNSSESGKNLSKLGSAAFSPEERQGLADEPYQFGEDPQSLKPVFEAHAGPVSQAAFERFLKVQVLWEEYMAAQIRRALAETQGQVVVLVGKGHLTHGYGLPHRVQRAWPQPLRQQVVLCDPGEAEKKRADLWWVSGL